MAAVIGFLLTLGIVVFAWRWYRRHPRGLPVRVGAVLVGIFLGWWLFAFASALLFFGPGG